MRDRAQRPRVGGRGGFRGCSRHQPLARLLEQPERDLRHCGALIGALIRRVRERPIHAPRGQLLLVRSHTQQGRGARVRTEGLEHDAATAAAATAATIRSATGGGGKGGVG